MFSLVQIYEMQKFKAIIIDDIAQSRATLKEDLEAYCPEIEVIGEAEGVVSGARLLKKTTPDVLFLDIQMPDGTGFDLLEILPEIPFKIIFTTASDAFAIRAFRFSAVDYLLKPVDPDDLMEAVNKLKSAPASGQDLDLLLDNMKSKEAPTKLSLHTQDKIQIVNVSDIIRCESSGNYTIFHFADGTNLMVTRTLKEYDQLLGDSGFFRVHQSHLVNKKHITAYVKTEGGYLLMSNNQHVAVSLRKKASVMEMLDKL